MRVLQEKEIVRVGSTQPVHVDFRCIAATNRDLEALIEAHAFRSDLFYRLNVVRLHLPPLRERREEIPLLVDHFLQKFSAAMNRPGIVRVAPDAMELLLRHDWPGNVRELENAVERAMVVGRGPEIKAGDFSFPWQAAVAAGGRTLEDAERSHIERIWSESGGNHSQAARTLGIDRTTLYKKLKRYGME
jgi:two-component system response regulator HydG